MHEHFLINISISLPERYFSHRNTQEIFFRIHFDTVFRFVFQKLIYMAQQAGRSAASAVSRFTSSKVDWNRLFKLSGSNSTTVSSLQSKWSQAAVK